MPRRLVNSMMVFTDRLPGTLPEKREMRNRCEDMVAQIQLERGAIPALFMTLTCAVNQWSALVQC